MLGALALVAAAAVLAVPASARTGQPGGPVYAADFSGADIGARVNAAIAALDGGGTVVLPAGNFTFATTIVVGEPIWLVGQGVHGTVLSYAGTGPAILVEAGGQPPYLSGGLRDFELNSGEDGTGVGVLQVNTIGFTYRQLAVVGFAIGIWLDNRAPSACSACGAGYSERTDWERVSFFDNSVGLELTSDGGTNSFEYSWMWACHFQIGNGQVGIWVNGDGTAGSVYLEHSDMNFMANICLEAPDGPPGTVASVTNGGYWGQGFIQATAEQSCGTAPGVMWNVDGASSVDAVGGYDSGLLANTLASTGSLDIGAGLPTGGSVGNGAVVLDQKARLDNPVLAGATLESAVLPSGYQFVAGGTVDVSQGSLYVPQTIESDGAVLTLPSETDTLVGASTPATLTNKTLVSPALVTPTIGGETITEPPHVAVALFVPGPLDAPRTVAQWIPDRPIVLTGIAATAQAGPLRCGTPAVIAVSQGTAQASIPLAGPTVDSGALDLALDGGSPVTVRVSQGAVCGGPRRPAPGAPRR
ncbi:MAG: hypothetical protein ACRD13_14975, partial [Terriglobales bacterium]